MGRQVPETEDSRTSTLERGGATLSIPAQSDHRFRGKVISDSGGKLITFSGRPETVRGLGARG